MLENLLQPQPEQPEDQHARQDGPDNASGAIGDNCGNNPRQQAWIGRRERQRVFVVAQLRSNDGAQRGKGQLHLFGDQHTMRDVSLVLLVFGRRKIVVYPAHLVR